MSDDAVIDNRVVDVRKVWVPVTLLGAIFAAVVSATLVYARLIDHMQSGTVHLQPDKVVEGGGVAYKADVSALRNDLKWALIGEQKSMRKLLRGATLTCMRTRTNGGCVSWKIELPEEAE